MAGRELYLVPIVAGFPRLEGGECVVEPRLRRPELEFGEPLLV
jgi:hypothetical protein